MTGNAAKALVLTAALIGSSGCVHLEDVLGVPYTPARTFVVDGEVRSVEPKKGRLRIHTGRDATRTLRVDRRTRVHYGRREYDVRALERGDRVRVWIEVDRKGEVWADRIEVRRDVNERRSPRY